MEVAVLKNGSYFFRCNSVEKAMQELAEWYHVTVWQENTEKIEIRNIVTEQNGFTHVGDTILYSGFSSDFWCNKK